MRFFYKVLMLLLTSISVFAQVPQKISYQSVIRNSNNALIINSTVGMKVSVLQGGENGVSVYSETHTPTTNANGLVSLAIGTGTVVQGVFSSIDWSTGSYFVKTEIDPTGGVNYTLIGTSELLSVPFALHAKTASNSGGISSGTTVGEMLYWNGSAWVSVGAGATGQFLGNCQGIPTWGGICYPVLTTSSLYLLSNDFAQAGGNISSNGGAEITARGVCWSTESNPDLSDDHTTETSSMLGVYKANLNGLTPSTTYYLRAYATNSYGTGYGNEIAFTTLENTLIQVGVPYQGGVIAYVDWTGSHGLIATPSDYEPKVWRGNNLGPAGTDFAIGTGNANTEAIVALHGSDDSAAKFCFNLSLNGYNDWYLPSKDDMYWVLYNKQIIGGFVATEATYWTSSENGSYDAWYFLPNVPFSGWTSNYTDKEELKYFRPVRSF